jgi:hypothetical protein
VLGIPVLLSGEAAGFDITFVGFVGSIGEFCFGVESTDP